MVEVKFTNRDATPKVAIIKTRKGDVASIVEWYSAFYAGDRYTIHIDGKKVALDYNGRLQG